MSRLIFGGIVVDLERAELGGEAAEPGDLSGNEVALLDRLARADGEPVSREVLLQEVWGYPVAVVTRAVENAVSRLRRRLGPAAEHLKTVRGRGYALLDVTVEAAPEPIVELGPRPLPPVPLLEREPLLRQLELAWRGGHTRLALVGTPRVGTTSVAAAFASRLTGELGFWDGLLDRGTPPTDAGTAWVYDHADGVMDAIVEACPTRVLVVSRGAAPPGFRVWRVPPLTREGALALLRVRGCAADPRRVAPLLDAVGTAPLAVVWLAARLQLLGPEALLRRLVARPSELASAVDRVARHRSLDALLGWDDATRRACRAMDDLDGLIARGLVTRDAAGEAELCQLARFGAGGR